MKRAPNFSVEEVNLLLQIIGSKRNIVNCRKTDKVSIQKKEKAWKSIAAEFNARSESFPCRNIYALKKKHENLKKVLKKRPQDEITEPFGTILESPQMKLCNPADSNDRPQKNRATTSLTNNDFPELPETGDGHFGDGQEIEVSIPTIKKDLTEESGEYNPLVQDLQISGAEAIILPSECHHRKKRKYQIDHSKSTNSTISTNDAISAFSWAKVETIKSRWAQEKLKTEIEILKREHEQRMQFMKEKHDIEMRILKNELEKSELYLGCAI